MIAERDERGRPRKFVHGHTNKGKSNWWLAKPGSTNARTGRYRAQKLSDCSRCKLESIGGCIGRVEVHHKDGNPVNNTPRNRVPLCTCHHRLVENGRINLRKPKMPKFRTSKDGKRRYIY